MKAIPALLLLWKTADFNFVAITVIAVISTGIISVSKTVVLKERETFSLLFCTTGYATDLSVPSVLHRDKHNSKHINRSRLARH